MTFTVEREFKVYEDDSGDFVSVGPDGDALGLVELHQYENGRGQLARIVMKPEQARLLAAAIIEYVGPENPDSAEGETNG